MNVERAQFRLFDKETWQWRNKQNKFKTFTRSEKFVESLVDFCARSTLFQSVENGFNRVNVHFKLSRKLRIRLLTVFASFRKSPNISENFLNIFSQTSLTQSGLYFFPIGFALSRGMHTRKRCQCQIQ